MVYQIPYDDFFSQLILALAAITPRRATQAAAVRLQFKLSYNGCKLRGPNQKLGYHQIKESVKITEKVVFNIASEASYVYIFSGQKFNKNAKIISLTRFWKLVGCRFRSNSVARQVIFNWPKIGGKCQNSKIQRRHFVLFSKIVEELLLLSLQNSCGF